MQYLGAQILDRREVFLIDAMAQPFLIGSQGLVVLHLLLEGAQLALEDTDADTQIAQRPLPRGLDVLDGTVAQQQGFVPLAQTLRSSARSRCAALRIVLVPRSFSSSWRGTTSIRAPVSD
jgi:hypothetical protein